MHKVNSRNIKKYYKKIYVPFWNNWKKILRIAAFKSFSKNMRYLRETVSKTKGVIFKKKQEYLPGRLLELV